MNRSRTFTTEFITDLNETDYFNETTIDPEGYGFTRPEYFPTVSTSSTVFAYNALNDNEECILRGNAFSVDDSNESESQRRLKYINIRNASTDDLQFFGFKIKMHQ